MIEEAEGVWRLPLMPRDGINAYLLGDVLVDAGIAPHGPKVVRALAGRTVAAHALTHAHVDHAGGSKHVVDTLGVPMWAPAGDAGDVESGRPTAGPGRIGALATRVGRFAAVPVARRLAEGDDVADFRVVDAPGHSPGQIAFWRESDRVLVGGDVFTAMGLITTRRGIFPPPDPVNYDTGQNLRSMRKLADLEPRLALFGHGPPVHDAAARLRAVAHAS